MIRPLVILLLLGIASGCSSPEPPTRRRDRPTETHPLEAMKGSDCFTCHGITEPSIGPSYLRIAERYRGDASVRRRLIQKVQEGGGGLWGGAQMSRHPFLTDAELGVMIDWIRSIPERDSLLKLRPPVSSPIQESAGPLRLRLYALDGHPSPEALDSLPPLFTGYLTSPGLQAADLTGRHVLPLLAVVDGTFSIEQKGSYFLRLRGTSAGRLTINGDGVISPLEQDLETLIPLSPGDHAIHFSWPIRASGDDVALEWIPPDSLYYGPVPIDLL